MIGEVNVFRHVLLNSGLRPYTITLIPNGGMRKVFSQNPLFRNISMCRRLDSTLSAKSQRTPWKPLSDPVANRATLVRLTYVAGATGCVLLGLVWFTHRGCHLRMRAGTDCQIECSVPVAKHQFRQEVELHELLYMGTFTG